MHDFGEAFKKARMSRRATLREISKRTGKSIGYLSDVQQGRKGAPDLETVRKIEDFLGITDNHLLLLAAKQRTQRPTDVARRVQQRPKLAEALMRIENWSDEEIEQWLSEERGQEKSDAT